MLPTVGMGLCYAQMGLHLYRGDKTILQLVLIPPAALHKSRKDKKRVSHHIAEQMSPALWENAGGHLALSKIFLPFQTSEYKLQLFMLT